MKANQCLKTSLMAAAFVSCFATASAFAGAPAIATSPVQSAAPVALDYANAIEMTKPPVGAVLGSQLDAMLAPAPTGPGGMSPGSPGTGQTSPLKLPVSAAAAAIAGNPLGVAPAEYGAANQLYTTSRTNAAGSTAATTTTRYYPYRAAGRLFFKIGATTYVCSASLIKRGVIVTAAHCVADFAKHWYSGWQFIPAYDNGVAPYGIATAKSARVLASYFNGTDACAVPGVVCQNDVAVIVLNTNPGNTVGWLGYGWAGYGYLNNQALITQLGYPVALDGGRLQQRTDSQGFVSAPMSNNTVIGSLQTGGSSGGPWVVNLGVAPVLSGTAFGSGANHNIVVGVTSWGYVSTTVKQQGASPFTAANIVTLVNGACAAFPGSC